MIVLRDDPAHWPDQPTGTAVTIGVYDGVHRGHQHVLHDLVRRARDLSAAPAVLTFDRHPLAVVDPDRSPRLLTTVEQRIELLEARGVEVVAVLPFAGRVQGLTPAAFSAEVLADRLSARLVAVGADFRYGQGRTGDVATLRASGEAFGFGVEVIDLVTLPGDRHPVSSSAIRRVLTAGDVRAAARWLGRWYELRGTVKEGDGRGATIGVPTANLELPGDVLIPGHGVYAGLARHRAANTPAAINVGVRPTFDGQVETVEAHLLDFDGDLYGTTIDLLFVERIREERAFPDADALVAQIHDDVRAARALLADVSLG